MTGRICEGCPFVRDCPDCMFRGGESPVPQPNPSRTTPAKRGGLCDNGSVNETAPTEARQRFNRGLTSDSTPD